MTRNTFFGRAQALFDQTVSIAVSIKSGVSYICYLLVADDTTPMFPSATFQG